MFRSSKEICTAVLIILCNSFIQLVNVNHHPTLLFCYILILLIRMGKRFNFSRLIILMAKQYSCKCVSIKFDIFSIIRVILIYDEKFQSRCQMHPIILIRYSPLKKKSLFYFTTSFILAN